MISKVVWLFFLSLLFCLSSFAQNPQASVQSSNTSAPKSISWGVKLSYYGPKTDNVSSVFNALEDTAGLARGPQFNIYYLAGANLRYSLDLRNDVGIEGELSLAQTKLKDVTSVERVYTIGAQYYYHLQTRRPGAYGVDVGGGVGWLVANFERNYDNSRISLLKKSVRLNGAVEWWAAISQHMYLELEARYLFVPNIKVDYPQTTIKMSSAIVSVGMSMDF